MPKDVERAEIQDNIKCELFLQEQEGPGIPLTLRWTANCLGVCVSLSLLITVYIFFGFVSTVLCVSRKKNMVCKIIPSSLVYVFLVLNFDDDVLRYCSH